MSALENDEIVCPSCGGFEAELAPAGWCIKCLVIQGLCITCGNVNGSPKQHECWHCRDAKWREKNADAIEAYQLQGLSLTASMDRVRIDNRS